MNEHLTELVFLLDRSGSMAGLEQDTIGGFNAMLTRQKRESGEALVTTLLFDHLTEVVHDRIPLQSVSPMTEKDYQVRGCTAFIDALGWAIRHIETIHRYANPQDRPARTLFVITTDGMENASRHFTAEEVKGMVQQKQKESHWEFLFLGANMDALDTARHYGIREDRAVNFRCDPEGTAVNYSAISDAVSDFRACRPLSASWKEKIEEDYRRR